MFGKPRRGSYGPDRNPPVSVGEELDVTIEAVGEKGDGIAKKDGFILFVKGTKQGERCKIKITKVLQKVGFADKVGASTSPAEESQQAPQQEAPQPEKQSEYEDTDDFGEDDSEEEETEESE